MNNTKIVTFNLRNSYVNDYDSINGFSHRAGMVCDKILDEKPDVIAFQEIKQPALTLLKRMLPEYLFLGHFRNADYSGEGLYTAIRTESIELLGLEVIWLSPTPYIAGSRFSDQSECPRTCVMTHIRNKNTGEMMRIYNVHLDHISNSARELGMSAVFDYVEEQNKKLSLPYIILGDLNATPDSGVIKMCNDADGIFDATRDIPYTFHAFGQKQSKIDYIFLSDNFKKRVADCSAWTEEFDGIYLSDHFPVSVTISK